MGRRTGNLRAISKTKESSGHEKEKKRKRHEEEDKEQGEALLKHLKKSQGRTST